MASSYDDKSSSSSLPLSSWCSSSFCCRCRNVSVPYGVIILTILYVIYCFIIRTTIPSECWIDGEWFPLVDCLPSSTTTAMTINHSVMTWSTMIFVAAQTMILGLHLVCKTAVARLSGTIFFSLMIGYTTESVKLMIFPVPSGNNDDGDGDDDVSDLDGDNSSSEGIDYHYLLTMISYVCWTFAIIMLGWFVIQCKSEEDEVHDPATIAKGAGVEETAKGEDNDDGYSQSMGSTTSFGRYLRRGQICCIQVMEIFYMLLTLTLIAGVSIVVCCIISMSIPPTSSMVSTLLNAYTVSKWIWNICIGLLFILIAYILTTMASDAYKELPVSYVSVAGLSPTLAGCGIVLMQLTVMITQILYLPFHKQDESNSYINFARISPVIINYGSLMTIYFLHNFMFSFFDKDRWEDEELDSTDDDEDDDEDDKDDDEYQAYNTDTPVITINEQEKVEKTTRRKSKLDLEKGKMMEDPPSVTEYVCEVGPPSWMRKGVQYKEDTDDRSAVVIAEMNGNVFSCSQIGCVAAGQGNSVAPINKTKEAGKRSKSKRKGTTGHRRSFGADPYVSSHNDDSDIEVLGDIPASPKREEVHRKLWLPRWRHNEKEIGIVSEDGSRSKSFGSMLDQSHSGWRHDENENSIISEDRSRSKSLGSKLDQSHSRWRHENSVVSEDHSRSKSADKKVDQSHSGSPNANGSPIINYSDSMSMDATDVEFPDPTGGLYFSGHGIDATAVQSERRENTSKSFLGSTFLKPKRNRRNDRNRKNKKKALKALEVPQPIDESNEKTFNGTAHRTKRFSIVSDSKYVGSIDSNDNNSIVVSEVDGDSPSKNKEYDQQENGGVVTGQYDEKQEEQQEQYQHNPSPYVQQLAFSGRARKRGDRVMTVNAAGEVSSVVSGGTEQSRSLSQKMNRISLMQQSESVDEGHDDSTLSTISTLESIEKVGKAESFAMSVIPQMFVQMFETRDDDDEDDDDDDDDDTDLGTLEDGSTIDTPRSWRQPISSKQNDHHHDHQPSSSLQQRDGSVTSSPSTSTSKNSISSRYIPKYIPSGLPQPVSSVINEKDGGGEEEKSVWTKTSGTSSAVTTPVKNTQNMGAAAAAAASTGSGVYFGRYGRKNNQLSSYMDSVVEENDEDMDWESIGEY